MAEDKQKRLLRYLNDCYATEMGGLISLKDLAAIAHDPMVKSVVEDHIRVTTSQAERLRNRILFLGGDKSEPKALVNEFFAKSSSFVNMFHDKEDKQTQDLIKAFAFEHFEIGTYQSLRAYSEAIGDQETAMLAISIMDEERMAAEQFERLIPSAAVQAVNKTAQEAHRTWEGEKKSHLFDIPAAAFILPGAVLAVWGVSKFLESRNKENQFGTATTAPAAHEYTIATTTPVMVDTVDTEMVGTTGTTVYNGDNVYVPSSMDDESGEDLIPSGTTVGGSTTTFGGSTLSDSSTTMSSTNNSRVANLD